MAAFHAKRRFSSTANDYGCPPMKASFRMALIVSLALAAGALMVAGCGGGDKPDYCSDVSDLQSSVDELESVDLGGTDTLSTVQTDVDAIQSDVNAVVSSAKADFPDETSALESSFSTLSTSVKELPASPTAEQLLALAPQIASTVSASDNLKSATSSACD
jgi:outer membrane murein-binding lipoprotein Lpp